MSESRLSVRPMFTFSAAFFLCGILSVNLNFKTLIVVTAVSAAVLLLSIFTKLKRNIKKFLIPVLIGITLALALILISVNTEKRSAELALGRTENCEIKVTSVVGATPNFGSYYGKVLTGDAAGLNVSFTAGDGSLTVGDIIKCNAEFNKLNSDEAERLAAERIFLSCSTENISNIGNDDTFSIHRFFEKVNSRLSARMKVYGGGALGKAVLLGNRDGLDLDVRRDFARLGISHLLAVSGLHLSLIVVIVESLMSKSGISLKNRSIIKIPVILLYMGVTGFSGSVLRAGIMHLIKAVGDFIDRHSDPLTSLGIAAVLITLFDPYSIYDVGLILSVLSAYACITFGYFGISRRNTDESTSRISKFLRTCFSTALLTVWITVNTLPVTVRYFGSISLISPLTNIIFIPAVTLLLCLSIIHLVTCKVPFIGPAVTFILSNTEKVICGTASKISHLPSITVPVKGLTVFFLALLLFICIAGFPIVSIKIKKYLKVSGFVFVSLIVLHTGLFTIQRALSIDALYVTSGKNEGFIIRDGLDYTLIDISDGSKKMAYTMYENATEDCASEIETLVLTHLHSKHVASVNDLTGRIIVRKILLPEAENDNDRDTYGKLTELCREKNIEILPYTRSNEDTFSDGAFNIAFHSYTKLSRSTHPVVTFEFVLDGKKYLYGGGSRSESEDFCEATVTADTVFLGNHHPKTKEFSLQAVKRAVVSAGEVTDKLKDDLKNCSSTVYLPPDSIYYINKNSIEKVEK